LQTSEMTVLSGAIEGGEVLVDVIAFAHEDLPRDLSALRMHFSSSIVCIWVDPDNDTLHVSDSVPSQTLSHGSVLAQEPWHRAAGKPILWAWRLINQQGYGDGIQVSFSDAERNKELVVVQLIGKASTIDVAVVERISSSRDPG
jgi:hypothetical protein